MNQREPLHFTNVHASVHDMPQDQKTFGVWNELRVLRERTGFSSADLAREANIPPSLMSMLENGKRWPTTKVTKKLADALKVPYTVLERPESEKESAA
jgi:transcriptional regulator with XRE-family HTH domain